MKAQIHFMIFVFFVLIFGIGLGITSKVLWEFKQFLIAGIVGYFTFVVSKRILVGIVCGGIAFFLVEVLL